MEVVIRVGETGMERLLDDFREDRRAVNWRLIGPGNNALVLYTSKHVTVLATKGARAGQT